MTRLRLGYILILLLLLSCSTTKFIPDGSYRLRHNRIELANDEEFPNFNTNNLNAYIRQKTNTYFVAGWNPGISIYNWANGNGNKWDDIVQRLGTPPVILDTTLIAESVDNIKSHLDYNGYYNSIIKDSVFIKDKIADVNYVVELGNRYTINELEVIINDTLLRNLYISDTSNSLVGPGVLLSESILEEEAERITTLFRNNGYFGFSQNFIFFEADTIGRKDSSNLQLRIENFTRNESEENSRPHFPFTIDEVYIHPVRDNFRHQVALANNLTGYLDTLKYEGVNILYDKNLNIRPSVLARMNTIRPDSLYNEENVGNTYKRYSSLNFYNSVSIEMNQVDSNTVNSFITLVPSKAQGYKVNLEASSNSSGLMGLSPNISYYHRNIFKGGERFNLSLLGNFQFSINDETIRSNEFGASTGISFPTFLFLPDQFFKVTIPRTELNFSYTFNDRPEFTRTMFGASFGYNWNSANDKIYYKVFPLQMNLVKMYNISDDFYDSLEDPYLRDTYKDNFDIGGGFNVSYYSDPTGENSNIKTALSVDIAGNLLSAFAGLMDQDTNGDYIIWGTPYSQYLRLEYYMAHNLHFGKNNNQTLASRFLAGYGYAYGNSTSLPFQRSFWAGGANSLRGWQARAVGPGSSPRDTIFSIPNQTGDMKLEANLEYRFPLFSVLKGAMFFDAGNIWNLKGSESSTFSRNFYKQIAFNTGLGLRIDIDFVVVRFDLGIKLYDPQLQQWKSPQTWLNNDGFTFQFGIGYPF